MNCSECLYSHVHEYEYGGEYDHVTVYVSRSMEECQGRYG